MFSVTLDLVIRGIGMLSWSFLLSWPREVRAGGGIFPELVNTATMVGTALLVSVPLGLASAVLRVEYGKDTWFFREFDRFTQTFLSMPSVVIGLVVFQVFINSWGWPMSWATGTVALILLNWPFVVTHMREVLWLAPDSLREGSLALGATRLQTLVRVILPTSLPAMVDNLGLAMARLTGESAALVFTAGVNVSHHFSVLGPSETLAIHLWYLRTEGIMPDAAAQAAGTGLVLLGVVFLILLISRRVASWLRHRW